MSFYYFQENMGIFLENTLHRLINNKRESLLQDVSVTWVNYQSNGLYQKGFGCGFNNNKSMYPASIVKLVYGLAIYKWIAQDKIIFNQQH